MEEEHLPNGARVVVARRPGVPLAAVRLLVRAGAALDPAGRHGLAHLVAQAARRGTRRRSGRRIDEEIEGLGAELGAGADEDATSFGLSAPAEFLPRLLDVVVDVATCPTFPQGEVERLRRREVASLVHDLDEPGVIADRAMIMAVYGEHPYGHPVEGRARHLAALRRSDAAGFHRRWYGPGVATLVIVGAVDPAQALRLARRRLGGWRPAAREPPDVPAPAPRDREVWVVDKPDATQVQVRIAVPALPRHSPEYFPAVVANTILGGGFTSRLMEAIRVNRGLSYGARSRFSMSRSAGLFYVSSFTKVESTAELVEVALDEVRRFRDEGPTAEELERAKGYLCGLFPLSLETHDQIAEKICDLSLYGFGIEEVSGYRERVRAVTAEACREVGQRHLPDRGGVIVVVGPAKAVAPAVERFGPVTVSPARRVL
jgi:zinc protease